ncbi:MAG: FCD domain-containing protein [Halomonas sp.]|uniref:FadR/GntR family transcriptional regulator n=1 Tax=Halomonadaceae TaxID=28256 RepID=UPI001F317431|nr:FCD domain-containing protein [Halomonas tianxiuensis]MDX5434558.1 FCD domain-containing protein [Halomonas sp.]MDX5504017.1 FCD domain-containing protein [Halomonas sp.]
MSERPIRANDNRGSLAENGIRSDGARALARYVRAEIVSGRFPPGHRLPTERELSDRFGASRGAVRRVLGHFKSLGAITQVVGSGTFVSERAAELLSPSGGESADIGSASAGSPSVGSMARQVSPAQLMDARVLIEPQMVTLIVRFATAADFARMDECLERSESATSIEAFEHWDGALHQAFAEATHNSFFLRILELTNAVREEGEWGRLKRISLTPERRKRYEAQHRAIVAALRDRDEQTARALLEEHLGEVKANLFGRG